MKRSKREETHLTDEEIHPPRKKKRKLNHNDDMRLDATSNSNNKRTLDEERKDEVIHEDFEDIAFFLTKSPFIVRQDKQNFNTYALGLDDVIASCAGSIIEKCVICSFKVDPEWMFNICPILKNKHQVEQIYILHGESLDEHYNLCNFQSIYDHLRIFKVKMNISYGTHHTKMILLLYKNEGIRIVITTANMIQKDWLYKTNAIYLQDFPLKTDTNITSEFGDTLRSYCNKLYGLSNRLILDFTFLDQYDFSSAKVLLIPSVPGYHRKNDIHLFGHKRLQYLLSKYKVATNQNHLVLNCSSIGSLTDKWLMHEFFGSSFDARDYNENRLEIIWPTPHDVRNSIEGYAAGSSLCFSKKCCKSFLYKYFVKWNGENSGRQRLMPHIKTYSVVDKKEKELKCFILSSANLSTAAWGQLQKNNTQLFIRSFEMGMLYLPQIYLDHYMKHKHRGFTLTDLPLKKRNVQIDNKVMDDVDIEFKVMYEANSVHKTGKKQIIFPIPMEVMATERYTKEDKPWVWDVEYSSCDLFGLRWP